MTSSKPSSKNKVDFASNTGTFHLLFANHPIPMWIYDLKTLAFLEVNGAALEKYGYTRDEFLALTIKDIRPAEDVEVLVNTLKQKPQSLHHSGEWRHCLKNGQVINVDITTHALNFEGRRVVLVMAQDITERKQVEEALAQHNNALLKLNNFSIELSMLSSEDNLEALIVRQLKEIAVAEVAIFSEYDPVKQTTTPKHIEVKPELLKKTIDLLGKQVNNIHSFVSDETYRVITSETIGTRKNLYEASFGAIPRPVSAAIQTLLKVDRFIGIAYLIDGKLYGTSLLGMCKDQPDPPRKILENFVSLATLSLRRKRAEESLKESERRFATIFRANPAAIAITRLDDGHLVDVNAAWQRMTGYVHTEVVGHIPQELNLWVDPKQREHLFEMVGEHDKAHGEMQLRCKSGEVRDLLMSAELIELTGKRYLLTMAQDITESKKSEEKLRRSELTLHSFIANSPDTMYLLDLEDHTSKYLNCEEFCGYPKSTLESPASIMFALHSDDVPGIQANWQQMLHASDDDVASCEYRLQRRDGNWEWIQQRMTILSRTVDGKPSQVLVTLSIITERKQAEQKLAQYSTQLEEMVQARTSELREAQEKLVRNEKLAVLGQLAGGVGHELRNPLAVINNALYYLKLVGASGNEKVKEYLGIIETETHTAEKIITDLLDFARVKSVDMEAISALKLTERVLGRYPAPKTVSVRLEIPEDLPMLYADPHQIEQVLGNLIINACQAMSAGGELKITAYREQEMVAIAVKDTGVGIPPENMKKLFEPLFTTKAKGIGLGLAVSQKLVEANGGRIEVESEAGRGSTFTLILPVLHH